LTGVPFLQAPLEARQRASDLIVGHAVRDPEVPGTAEALGGHRQQIVIQSRKVGERLCVAAGRFDKHVKGAFRHDAPIARVGKPVVQKLSVGVVRREIGMHVDAFADDALDQGRRTDVAQEACGAADGVVDVVRVIDVGRHQDVPDAVAGHRQDFAVRIADDGVAVQIRNERCRLAVVDELAVRLVGDDVDRVADLVGRAIQHLAQRPQFLRGIQTSRRVVRGVDDHGPRVGTDPRFDGIDRQAEVGIRRRHDRQLGVLPRHVGVVFGEVRRERDEFVGFVVDRQRAERRGQRGRGAARHEHIVLVVRRTVARVQGVGDRSAHAGIAGRARVAVQRKRRGVRQKRFKRLVHGVGRRHAGIAQTEIKDVLAADLFGDPVAVFEQFADGGALAPVGERVLGTMRGGSGLRHRVSFLKRSAWADARSVRPSVATVTTIGRATGRPRTLFG
jgi:hypothetical protein